MPKIIWSDVPATRMSPMFIYNNFGRFGYIVNITSRPNNTSGGSTLDWIIEYKDPRDAFDAILSLDGTLINGLHVKLDGPFDSIPEISTIPQEVSAFRSYLTKLAIDPNSILQSAEVLSTQLGIPRGLALQLIDSQLPNL